MCSTRSYDDFFAVGLIQANGIIWRLADDQSKLVASFLIAAAEGHERAAWMRALKAKGHAPVRKGSYVQSERHRLEANYYDYRRLARKLLRGFGAMATAELKSSRWAKPVSAVRRRPRQLESRSPQLRNKAWRRRVSPLVGT